MMKVAILDTVHPVIKTRLIENGFECEEHLLLSREEIQQGQLKDIQGIVLRSRIRIDDQMLDAMPQLKWIARSGSGLENINVQSAKSRDIHVYNSPEGNSDAVGEHVLGMLLMIMHKLRSCDKSVHEKVWEREKHRGMELGSKTVGIIGYGVMGKALATKLRGIGCTIIAYDKYTSGFSDEYVNEVTEEEFFRRSEIVSVHLPLTDETNGLIDSTWLARFLHPFIFVNSSRGSVVNTKDLLDALDTNQVTSIALDVLEFEGRSFEGLTSMGTTDDQKTLSRLLESPNVYLSPHVAGWTTESYFKLSHFLAEKILKDFSA
jgi:D-3-phosphoglycerate dehydrogenase / 2-oxoglutarate reductase